MHEMLKLPLVLLCLGYRDGKLFLEAVLATVRQLQGCQLQNFLLMGIRGSGVKV